VRFQGSISPSKHKTIRLKEAGPESSEHRGRTQGKNDVRSH
jgi:hypothetical protein